MPRKFTRMISSFRAEGYLAFQAIYLLQNFTTLSEQGYRKSTETKNDGFDPSLRMKIGLYLYANRKGSPVVIKF